MAGLSPLVSVLMPVLNCARTVGLSIRSILMQTYQNWELLVIDDGSSDDTVDVVASFSDPRITFVADGQHKGLALRLNESIDLSRGYYAARMDGDDVAYPSRLEKQVKYMEQHPEVDLLGAWVLVFGANGRPLGRRTGPLCHADIARRPNTGFRMLHPTWTGRLSWFRRHYYQPDAIRCEDHDLLFRAHRDSVYANFPEILLGYREEHLELSKILRSRWYWILCLRKQLNGAAGVASWTVAAAVCAAKACVDCVAVVSGLDYRLLRQRAEPTTEEDRRQWRNLWDGLHSSSSCSFLGGPTYTEV